jgi:hypothetical protein
METNVSEAVLPPSSGLEFLIKEIYPLTAERFPMRNSKF